MKLSLRISIFFSILATASQGFGIPPAAVLAQQPTFLQQDLNDVAPLKPGDRLRITVVGFPDISGEQVVMADGRLQIPLAGDINVWGLSPTQATRSISTALAPYVKRPQVSIAIESLSPTRISITGEVVRSGPLVLDTPSASLHGASTLSDALSLAGGVTPNADLRHILIRRHIYANRGLTSNNFNLEGNSSPETITVDLWQSISDGNLSADVPIFDGDEIIVPTDAQLQGSNQQALLSSTVSPSSISVNVGGEVNSPGILEIPPNSDVNSAVAAAGGITVDGSAQNIVLFRTAPDGTLENHVYELGENSIVLKHGDSIIVSQSTRSQVRSFLEIFSRVLFPIGWFVN